MVVVPGGLLSLVFAEETSSATHGCRNYTDEDLCRLRTGHGPQNMTRLRRFAVGLIKANSNDSVAATIDKLARRVRRVFDYLLMTDNTKSRASRVAAQSG
ncbi:MAG: hypothetical protein N838_21095 [Thiohalocapsa sp. PB-PSB1]|nr:MAG: hypothetical protein N838_30265 [Thiohalocapsa sp. PB-PSB1]QQO55471.1 MAG: hypothetical protein N838_21095 [Thiohalocapsa sp. PB-PSB1]